MTKRLPTTERLLDLINDSLAQRKEADDRQFVTALGRGLILLSAFEYHEQLGHQQLCQMTKLPKATVTRLVHTLTTLGFLRTNAQGQYQLGSSSVRLSAQAWSRHDVVAFSEPLLRQFVMQNEVSVNLATEIEGEMRYLACYRSPARLSINLQVGSAVPVARTAIGRTFYAVSSPTRQAVITANLKAGLPVDDFQQAQKALIQASQYYETHGYTLSDGDFSTDILAVAVGVFDVTTGHYAYSLNASVPRANWEAEEYAAMIVPKLQVLSESIGRGA
ncbi:IclR family transcriptional regulator [Psychrobacter sp. DAB_AL32B]|uniref:IclR family transcriptional regulator n=1 Tax=Psychrobacter sp. DAB_AL32B TaxID=1028414 RepID=UPI000B7CE470|nr:helix-turn-helix domain-containing protein [Psychrobacter sp. DAB_AL32B]OXL18935.1 IclR family transcriptional regulator [Psychrobacter sp. DAB_AL32B]QBQ68710.1 transcriptional regulator, IclR family [Psychrobacter sp. DAB_AL32B]